MQMPYETILDVNKHTRNTAQKLKRNYASQYLIYIFLIKKKQSIKFFRKHNNCYMWVTVFEILDDHDELLQLLSSSGRRFHLSTYFLSMYISLTVDNDMWLEGYLFHAVFQ